MRYLEEFFAYARERHKIMLMRREGYAKPWTKDPILQQYRFCNVFREDDTTTRWIKENVRDPLSRHPRLLQAIVIARWFNRIETLQLLSEGAQNLLVDWDSDKVRERLDGVAPIVTGAYMIKTPAKMNKLEGLIWSIEQIVPDCQHLQARLEPGTTSLKEVTAVLCGYPYLGPFMAYEIVTDLRHTPLLGSAPDIMTWANPGPGAMRGCGRVAVGDKDHYKIGNDHDTEAVIGNMRKILEKSRLKKYWHTTSWPRWEMREVEHTLCEFDKYQRAVNGQGTPKQRYKGA